ncbi:MAG: PQQ-dependent sugar dehydrogenase [Proteobacteria bacterium]|nr:PQQ-dependent sugar dehydrogenase [Pseudomonadota bacterium]
MDLAFAPDGRVFIATLNGRVRIIKDGVLLPQPFITISVNSRGERGLLGLALDDDRALAFVLPGLRRRHGRGRSRLVSRQKDGQHRHDLILSTGVSPRRSLAHGDSVVNCKHPRVNPAGKVPN